MFSKKNYNFKVNNRLQPIQRPSSAESSQIQQSVDQLSDVLKKFTTQFLTNIRQLSTKLDKQISSIGSAANLGNQSTEFSEQNSGIEERFQKVKVPMPSLQKSQRRRQEIQQWLGEVCKRIFSTSFKYLLDGVMTEDATKLFCSENLIFRIIQFISLNNLKKKEIQHINSFLTKQILPYFLLKYPQTEAIKANLRLSREVIQINNFNSNTNQLVYLSQTQFQYNSTGIYTSQIMKVLNFIIRIPTLTPNISKVLNSIDDEDLSKQSSIKHNNLNNSIYTLFQNDMELLFKSIQKQQEVIRMKSGEDPRQVPQHQRVNEAKSQKYKEKVQQYTKYLIGRKIPQDISQFKQSDLTEKKMTIKSSQILRILNKLCESLEEKFFKMDKVIINREEQFRMMDGSQAYLKKTHRILLSKLLEIQKKQIQKYLEKVMENNYSFQKYFGSYQIPSDLKCFTKEESAVGLFAAAIFKNNENYIIGYLNRLIHGLLTATTSFQEIIKFEGFKSKKAMKFKRCVDLVCEGKMSIEEVLEMKDSLKRRGEKAMGELVPQLVTFRLGDLLRCKCSSKQTQITALYREIQRISRQNPQMLEVIRVKNRLDSGNKDILINAIYRKMVVVQIQLKFDENKHNFITSSNNFNHYLYELKRAQFGPISELCNIWINKDYRAKFYQSFYTKMNKRQQVHELIHECKSSSLSEQTLPIVCSFCQVIWTNINCIDKNYHCSKCKKNICGLCSLQINNQLIKTSLKTNLQGVLPPQHTLQLQKQIIPNSGACINVNLRDIFIKQFVKVEQDKIQYLFEQLPNGEYILMKQLYNSKDKQEFLKDHAVVGFPKNLNKPSHKIITDYFVPMEFQRIYKQQRNSVVQQKQFITDEILSKIQRCYYVKKINFSQNKISNIQLIEQKFPNLEIAVLNQNQISSIPPELKDMNLKYLDLSRNNIKDIPQIINLQKLTYFNLSQNSLSKLPSLANLKELKTLNVGFNQLTVLPELPLSLKKIDAQENKLSNQFDISPFKLIKALNLSHNKLKQFNGAKDIFDLKYLQLAYNNFEQLRIQNIQSLEHANLSYCNCKKITIIFSNPKNSCLRSLNLAYNKITELDKQFFTQICRVQYLNLANNKINKVPKHIYQLTNLDQLVIQGIYKQNMSVMQEIQSQLHIMKEESVQKKQNQSLSQNQNQNQKILDLSLSNEDEQILPSQLHSYLLNLNIINMGRNALTEIPSTITKMPHLQQLIINDNNISKIQTFLGVLTLDISQNKFIQFTKEMASQMPTLRKLILTRNLIAGQKSKDIQKLFHNNNVEVEMDDDSNSVHSDSAKQNSKY